MSVTVVFKLKNLLSRFENQVDQHVRTPNFGAVRVPLTNEANGFEKFYFPKSACFGSIASLNEGWLWVQTLQYEIRINDPPSLSISLERSSNK